MPVVLGSNGIERLIDVHLDSDEKAKLKQSAAALKEICDKYVK